MAEKKFLILNSCTHGIKEELYSILGHSFDCEIQEVLSYPINSSIFDHWRPNLIVCVIDDVNPIREVSPNRALTIPTLGVICSESTGDVQVESYSEQFGDLIMTPLRAEEVSYRISRLLGKLTQGEKTLAKKTIFNKLGMAQVIGQDPEFLDLLSKIPMIADCDATILLTGETGVGKEVCARSIHYLSSRSDRPFVPVNCGAIPTTLVENELFGHKRGAYTDARSNQFGLVNEAKGGTLFLDEIDGLPMNAQSKLLRLLQDKTYRPLGDSRSAKADIRVIAATNADLSKKMKEGQFRADLYYRLTVALHLPPLRKRKRDIPLLTEHFLKKYANEYGRGHRSFSPAGMEKLLLYDWPGNIRELENVIQQTILLTNEPIITAERVCIPVSPGSDLPVKPSFTEAKRKIVEEFERDFLTRLLISCQGNVTRAAIEAKKDRGDLSKLVKKYDLDPKSFRYSTP